MNRSSNRQDFGLRALAKDTDAADDVFFVLQFRTSVRTSAAYPDNTRAMQLALRIILIWLSGS
jgi:hypothetical protein